MLPLKEWLFFHYHILACTLFKFGNKSLNYFPLPIRVFPLRCIFRPVQRLSSLFFFQFKYRIPLGLRLRIVYKFKCQCCDALYFGETIRHLHTCISEHMGISACTGKPLSKSSFSDILSHHQSSGHPIEL